MSHRYTSFLLRHWHLAEGELRITVEQLQTGAAVTVPSLAAATAWLGEQTASASSPEWSPPVVATTGGPTGGPAS